MGSICRRLHGRRGLKYRNNYKGRKAGNVAAFTGGVD